MSLIRPCFTGYLILVICQFIWSNTFAQTEHVFKIPYTDHPIITDGNLNDWDTEPVVSFKGFVTGMGDVNQCSVYLAWDETNLYFGTTVRDKFLVGLESSHTPKRINYNDSFEFYLDAKNDSRDTMDFNDFQFLFDLHGGCTVFASDPLDSALKLKVPKDIGIATVLVKNKAQVKGTINYNGDSDDSYSIECIIPWEGIGVIAQKELRLKADFCLNDNDTIVDFKILPPGPVVGYGGISYLGFHDFGYPDKWVSLQLEGSASFLKQLTYKYANNWLLFLLFSIVCIALAVGAFVIQIKKPVAPVRGEEENQTLVHYLMKDSSDIDVGGSKHDLFDKAKTYVAENLNEPITVEQLSGIMGLGVRQTQRLFKSGLDTTPTAFVLAIKLEHAAQLLTSTQKNVAEVAYAVGFSDPSYFSRTFKRYFGIAPSDYQKQS